MKSQTFAIAIAMVGVFASPTRAQEIEEVRAVIERHYAAIHAADLETVFGHHLPDMTWFSSHGNLLFESGAVEAAERMGTTLDFGTTNVYMNHFDAQIYGNVAVATFYLVGTQTLGTETKRGAWRVTAVWVRENGEWKEAHHHESPLIGQTQP